MSSSLLWTPGMAGPLEELVTRIHRRIELFAEQRGWDKAFVEIEFVDGVRYGVHSISPEPGFGFITICPYPEDDERPWPRGGTETPVPPEELIVPIGSIKRITLGETPADEPRFGFSLPES